MKKTLIIGLLVIFVLISGCTTTTTTTPAGQPTPGATTPAQISTEQQVNIKDFNFVPNIAEVPMGTTVTWVNDDNVPHTITSVSGSFDSGSIGQVKHTASNSIKPEHLNIAVQTIQACRTGK